jgi:hypothetical protein
MSRRAEDIKKLLGKLYDKLAFLENKKVDDADPKREFQLKNDIEETRAETAKYEAELAQLTGASSSTAPPVAGPVHSSPPNSAPPGADAALLERPPKVFISYSHDSKAHADRVLQLSNRLRSDFIDAHLDQYEVAPPEGWLLWMDKQVRECDFTVMVCTETYRRRCDGEEAAGKGQGVKWERNLVYNQLYANDSLNKKLIPVFFPENSSNDVPLPLQGFTRHRLGSEDGYQGLLRHLRGQASAVKPPLGAPAAGARVVSQTLPERKRQTSFDMSIELLDALNGVTPTKLKQVIYAVNMPTVEQLGDSAPHGDQVVMLLKWAESKDGCGLEKIREVLNRP